jgi:hypothetical protein
MSISCPSARTEQASSSLVVLLAPVLVVLLQLVLVLVLKEINYYRLVGCLPDAHRSTQSNPLYRHPSCKIRHITPAFPSG